MAGKRPNVIPVLTGDQGYGNPIIILHDAATACLQGTTPTSTTD